MFNSDVEKWLLQVPEDSRANVRAWAETIPAEYQLKAVSQRVKQRWGGSIDAQIAQAQTVATKQSQSSGIARDLVSVAELEKRKEMKKTAGIVAGTVLFTVAVMKIKNTKKKRR